MDIDLLILDFDGVLTDNRVYVMQDGQEAVACHRGDGWGINLLRNAGLEVIILSTETNPVVSTRAEKLGIECNQGCSDKAEAIREIIEARRLDPARVMYVGNDTNDTEAMAVVGHPVAPADAHPEILKIAKTVTQANGGQGVVRELADFLLSTS
jgi:YrbI family 3-deoxy-D-manno-octulosonate 8-phosphate phosphatase|tara:strand:- start:186 stop:647 length:462 start_codon:yes stop_codon:yes gene_type:complete